MSKTIEEILAPKPEVRPRICAYLIADEAHDGLLKVGQTTRDVKQRIAEQLDLKHEKSDVTNCDIQFRKPSLKGTDLIASGASR